MYDTEAATRPSTPAAATTSSSTTTASISLYGEGGNDWIISATDQGSLLDGGEGNDTLFAYFGGNTLIGGAGNDVLETPEGGAVANIFTGGADADTFVYRAGVCVEANVIVTDFQDGVDHIGLRSSRSTN